MRDIRTINVDWEILKQESPIPGWRRYTQPKTGVLHLIPMNPSDRIYHRYGVTCPCNTIRVERDGEVAVIHRPKDGRPYSALEKRNLMSEQSPSEPNAIEMIKKMWKMGYHPVHLSNLSGLSVNEVNSICRSIPQGPDKNEHEILVAVVVRTPMSRAESMRYLLHMLENIKEPVAQSLDDTHVDSYWIAEDSRPGEYRCAQEGLRSAVFVPEPLTQAHASGTLARVAQPSRTITPALVPIRTVADIRNLAIVEKESALKVIQSANELIDAYGHVSVNDIRDLLAMPFGNTYADHKLAWTNPFSDDIVRVDVNGHWHILLPEPSVWT
jgi:hypothetical protein